MRFTALLSLPLFLLACSSESGSSTSTASEYDPLFEVTASGGDTTNVIGLWETTQTTSAQGVTATSNQRIEIRQTTVKLANRCSGDGYETITVGVTINVTVGEGSITTQDKGGVVTKQSNGP